MTPEERAYKYANRIIALDWRHNPVKEDIAGDYIAGYTRGCLDTAAAKDLQISELEKRLKETQNSLNELNIRTKR